MKLKLEWGKPLYLKAPKNSISYSFDLSKLPDRPGIYIFGRKYGKQIEALYVGKAGRLRGRVKGQLNNLHLMEHINSAKNGKKIVLAAKFVAGPAQQEEKCLTILERALIRYFLAEGHDLVNKQGTQIRRHEITSQGGGSAVPKLMFVDRPKGE
jgi:hypothetical protein